jgi:hypothetical protein
MAQNYPEVSIVPYGFTIGFTQLEQMKSDPTISDAEYRRILQEYATQSGIPVTDIEYFKRKRSSIGIGLIVTAAITGIVLASMRMKRK